MKTASTKSTKNCLSQTFFFSSMLSNSKKHNLFLVSALIAYNLCYPISNDEISILFLLHPELPDLTSAKVLAQFGWVKFLDLLSLSKKIHLSYCKYVSDQDQTLFTCAAGCCGHFGKLQGIVSWLGTDRKRQKKSLKN